MPAQPPNYGLHRDRNNAGVALNYAGTRRLSVNATGVSVNGTLASTTGVTSTSPSEGIGYATGAGGAVTQITSRSTGVTMVPNPCLSGKITTDTTSLAAAAEATFTVTNSAVAIGDVIVLSVRSGLANAGGVTVTVSAVGAGTFDITIGNTNASAETGAIIINFAVIKAVSA